MPHTALTPSLYIFDLDGTLVDSAADICAAVERVLEEFGVPAAGAAVHASVATGAPLGVMFAALAPGRPADKMIVRYREMYSLMCADTTVPFPGVVETLAALGSQRCAVATTKKTWLAKLLLDKLGLDRHFGLIQGTDDFPYKPDPAILRRVLEFFETPPEQALMVGDTAADMLCARAAGVRSAAVLYGIGNSAELRACTPDYTLDRFSDLLALEDASRARV